MRIKSQGSHIATMKKFIANVIDDLLQGGKDGYKLKS